MVSTLLYERMPWTLNAAHYDEFRTVHLEVLQRILGFQRRADGKLFISYATTLKKTKCGIIETTIRKRRLFIAAAMVRKTKGRLPIGVMFAQVAGRKTPGPGGPPNTRLRALTDDLPFSVQQKTPRSIPHGSLELKPYCGSMQQTRGASDIGGPQSSRTVHGQVARRKGKYDRGAPRSPDTRRTKPEGVWGSKDPADCGMKQE